VRAHHSRPQFGGPAHIARAASAGQDHLAEDTGALGGGFALLRDMAGDVVPHLVSEHEGKLILGLKDGDEPERQDDDRAPRLSTV
jgi:hypothetical protein